MENYKGTMGVETLDRGLAGHRYLKSVTGKMQLWASTGRRLRQKKREKKGKKNIMDIEKNIRNISVF